MSAVVAGAWIERRACRNVAPETFFPAAATHRSSRITSRHFAETRERASHVAEAYCATCPVADDCLTYARACNVKAGVWGGWLFVEYGAPLELRCTSCQGYHDPMGPCS